MNGLFSEIFWLRKEKKSDYPLYKDFVHVFEVLYKNKTRIVIKKEKLRGTSFCDLSLIKTIIFIRRFYLKNGRLYEDEVNIKTAFLFGEYYLNYFTEGFLLRYIFTPHVKTIRKKSPSQSSFNHFFFLFRVPIFVFLV